MTMMIGLVGDQSLPNFLAARHYKYDDVLLVYTSSTKKVFERLAAILKKPTSTTKSIDVEGVETDAFDTPAISSKLSEKISELMTTKGTQPMVFNLTGGTKTMSIAATLVAQEYNAPMIYIRSEGNYVYSYYYYWKNGHIHLESNHLIPECLTLTDIFDIQLGTGWSEDGAGRKEGSPFEEALGQALRAEGYEVMVGVHALNGQVDLDVAIRFGNHYGIIEAKAGNSGRELGGIKQLNTYKNTLGTFSRTFYAITVPHDTRQDAIIDVTKIDVIELTGYDKATAKLSSADIALLSDKIGKKLK